MTLRVRLCTNELKQAVRFVRDWLACTKGAVGAKRLCIEISYHPRVQRHFEDVLWILGEGLRCVQAKGNVTGKLEHELKNATSSVFEEFIRGLNE